MLQSTKTGFFVGLKTVWALGKIIFPVALIVALLQHTPVLPWVIKLITPLMGIFGLSGDAAIPLVLGNFLNLYAAIGAMLTIDLTIKEVFIIAVMLSFSHNMFVESSVAIKVGVKLWIALAVRIGLAIFSGMIINLVWQGGSERAQYGLVAAKEESVSGVIPILFEALQTAALGIVQLAMIVMPLMIVIQVLKDLQWLQVFSRWMAPVTKALGMKENTSTTLAAGLIFGLAYGAGVMIQAVKEDGVSKKDVTIAFIFLAACHAVVEDTLIFIPLGIPVLPLLLIRLVLAIILTAIVVKIWNRVEFSKRKETVYDH
ncbi:nucleoside recognition domain-containing protein [Robertmurraya korlensis]|uniref:nucleoside recognition domain-containing protein n=1 Tax=Robertmurraya korlensis TaxID=519977 RepID=UPI00203CB7AD|nr:nucleoside recognition domain-containing protein [Robertmurraya korlensis]MCM3602519.1 nucleoside recognition domain-containing protein [Robertmurraya korlensis]